MEVYLGNKILCPLMPLSNFGVASTPSDMVPSCVSLSALRPRKSRCRSSSCSSSVFCRSPSPVYFALVTSMTCIVLSGIARGFPPDVSSKIFFFGSSKYVADKAATAFNSLQIWIWTSASTVRSLPLPSNLFLNALRNHLQELYSE